MKKDLINEKGKPAGGPIVIAGECGGSMWDDVLQQEIKACNAKDISKNAPALLNRIDAAQVSDTTEAQ